MLPLVMGYVLRQFGYGFIGVAVNEELQKADTRVKDKARKFLSTAVLSILNAVKRGVAIQQVYGCDDRGGCQLLEHRVRTVQDLLKESDTISDRVVHLGHYRDRCRDTAKYYSYLPNRLLLSHHKADYEGAGIKDFNVLQKAGYTQPRIAFAHDTSSAKQPAVYLELAGEQGQRTQPHQDTGAKANALVYAADGNLHSCAANYAYRFAAGEDCQYLEAAADIHLNTLIQHYEFPTIKEDAI